MVVRPRTEIKKTTVVVRRWIGQRKKGIIHISNMSGEMHMRRRRDAKVRYSAAYPTGAERVEKGES